MNGLVLTIKWLTLAFLFVAAGRVDSAPSKLRFSAIDLKSGLSQATVLDIWQDRQGFMWFATQDGLNRFDGYDFVVYRRKQNDLSSLSDNYVNNIFEDSQGYLWLTTRNGLNRYDPATDSFKHFYYDTNEPGSLSASWTFGTSEDGQGNIWVGTYESGLNVLNPKTGEFKHYFHIDTDPRSLSDNGIYDIAYTSNGELWVATRNGGLNRFDPASESFTRFVAEPDNPHALSHNKVYRIFEHSDGTLYFATRGGGLNRFDSQTEQFTQYRYLRGDPQSISGDQVWSIAEEQDGNLLVGTFTGGLNRFYVKTGKFERISHNAGYKESLPGNSVISSYKDDSGNFWFGVRDAGIAFLNPDIAVFNHYHKRPGDPSSLSDNSVQSFLQTHSGDILVATRSGGINIFNPNDGKFKPLHQVNNPNHQILAEPINLMAEDSQGNIWVSFKDHGLAKFNPRTQAVVQFSHDPNDPQSISSNSINVIRFDPHGMLWLATRGGLDKFDPNTGKVVKAYLNVPDDPQSIGSDWVSDVLIDSAGRLWAGTQKGLALLDERGDKFQHFRHRMEDPQSLSHNSVLSLFEDKDKRLWVATTSGLNRFNPEQSSFEQLKQAHGLSNDQIYGVLQDGSGFLWLTTNFGLHRYAPATGEIKLYTEQDGLQGNEFNQGAYYKLRDGRMLFGGVNGFNLVDPQAVKDNPYPPKVHLTNLRVFNQLVPVGPFTVGGAEVKLLDKTLAFTDQLSLSYRQSVFSFEFAAVHYSAPTRNQYAYRLVGFDRQWNYTDYKSRRATYTNLPAGDYTFEVKAANKDGVWTTNPTRLALHIQAPWWLTTGAKFLWLAMIFAILFVFYRYKTSQYRLQKARLQQQVSRQVAQVVAQKQALERSYHDIRVISDIGQRINASLDLEKVLWSVYENINQLMDGTVFGIGIYKPEKKVIQVELAVEKGNRYKPYYRSMENKNQFPVWCIEHDEVVFVNDLELDGRKYLERHEYDEYEKNRVYLADGAYAGPPQSLIYVPLRSANGVLGFITVQSFNRHAYQEVHIDILKTLAIYTANAIVNSMEHQQLLDSRKELIETEKMAALGMLVAGVAHEISTPVESCVTTASSLAFETEQVFDAKMAGRLSDKRLDLFFDKLKGGFETVLVNLGKTSELIANFKDVVVNPQVEVSSRFKVRKLLIETIGPLQRELDKKQVKLDLLCDEQFEVYTCASSLSRVINTLVTNSLVHGFANRSRGKISIFVTIDGDDLQLRYVDNGQGMSEAMASHIFEPFYTTKRADGCLGLGMHMVYNLVTQGLHGTVRCDTHEDEGMQIYISIPINNSL